MFAKLISALPLHRLPKVTAKRDHYNELVTEMTRRETGERKSQLDDALFHAVRDEIHSVVQTLRPNSGNGHLQEMCDAIGSIITRHGLTQTQYWDEVWRRGGCKAMPDYRRKPA